MEAALQGGVVQKAIAVRDGSGATRKANKVDGIEGKAEICSEIEACRIALPERIVWQPRRIYVWRDASKKGSPCRRLSCGSEADGTCAEQEQRGLLAHGQARGSGA